MQAPSTSCTHTFLFQFFFSLLHHIPGRFMLTWYRKFEPPSEKLSLTTVIVAAVTPGPSVAAVNEIVSSESYVSKETRTRPNYFHEKMVQKQMVGERKRKINEEKDMNIDRPSSEEMQK